MPDFNFSHAEYPPGMENTPSFLGKQFLQGKRQSHIQTWKRCQSCYGTSPYKEMRKMWIHVYLHQGALLRAGTLCSAHLHTQGEFHKTSNNWRWKVPTQWHFHASITMLRQPYTWKLPRMYMTREHCPTISKWHTDTDIQRKKSTFFQNHQNFDH